MFPRIAPAMGVVSVFAGLYLRSSRRPQQITDAEFQTLKTETEQKTTAACQKTLEAYERQFQQIEAYERQFQQIEDDRKKALQEKYGS